MKQAAKKLIHIRVVRFIGVGILNTIIDFTLFNTLLALVGNNGSRWAVVGCNTVSATSVAIVSFFLNKRYVFKSQHTPNHYTIYFVLITLFGLYLVQNPLIFMSLHYFGGTAEFFSRNFTALGLPFSQHFLLANGAKAVGTIGSTIWNYLWYKHVVFVAPTDKSKF